MELSTSENQQIIDHLLMTTRSVRKRLDLTRPVERAVIEQCIDIAVQAPTGGNRQGWHFMVVTDEAKRTRIGELYRQSFELYRGTAEQPINEPTDNLPNVAQMRRVVSSSRYLAQHMHEVPVMIIPCIEGQVTDTNGFRIASLYGSILPAAWSLMLALRSRRIGAAWTTLHLRYEEEVAQLLDIPDGVMQAALLPAAYYTGDDFKPAKRFPANERTYWDSWAAK